MCSYHDLAVSTRKVLMDGMEIIVRERSGTLRRGSLKVKDENIKVRCLPESQVTKNAGISIEADECQIKFVTLEEFCSCVGTSEHVEDFVFIVRGALEIKLKDYLNLKCLCCKKGDRRRLMLCCKNHSVCGSCYHIDCLNLNSEEVPDLSWSCPQCTASSNDSFAALKSSEHRIISGLKSADKAGDRTTSSKHLIEPQGHSNNTEAISKGRESDVQECSLSYNYSQDRHAQPQRNWIDHNDKGCRDDVRFEHGRKHGERSAARTGFEMASGPSPADGRNLELETTAKPKKASDEQAADSLGDSQSQTKSKYARRPSQLWRGGNEEEEISSASKINHDQHHPYASGEILNRTLTMVNQASQYRLDHSPHRKFRASDGKNSRTFPGIRTSAVMLESSGDDSGCDEVSALFGDQSPQQHRQIIISRRGSIARDGDPGNQQLSSEYFMEEVVSEGKSHRKARYLAVQEDDVGEDDGEEDEDMAVAPQAGSKDDSESDFEVEEDEGMEDAAADGQSKTDQSDSDDDGNDDLIADVSEHSTVSGLGKVVLRDQECNAPKGPIRRGCNISLMDPQGRWYKGKVLRVGPSRVKVHYIGWNSHWDEWIPTDSHRIDWTGTLQQTEETKVMAQDVAEIPIPDILESNAALDGALPTPTKMKKANRSKALASEKVQVHRNAGNTIVSWVCSADIAGFGASFGPERVGQRVRIRDRAKGVLHGVIDSFSELQGYRVALDMPEGEMAVNGEDERWTILPDADVDFMNEEEPSRTRANLHIGGLLAHSMRKRAEKNKLVGLPRAGIHKGGKRGRSRLGTATMMLKANSKGGINIGFDPSGKSSQVAHRTMFPIPEDRTSLLGKRTVEPSNIAASQGYETSAHATPKKARVGFPSPGSIRGAQQREESDSSPQKTSANPLQDFAKASEAKESMTSAGVFIRNILSHRPDLVDPVYLLRAGKLTLTGDACHPRQESVTKILQGLLGEASLPKIWSGPLSQGAHPVPTQVLPVTGAPDHMLTLSPLAMAAMAFRSRVLMAQARKARAAAELRSAQRCTAKAAADAELRDMVASGSAGVDKGRTEGRLQQQHGAGMRGGSLVETGGFGGSGAAAAGGSSGDGTTSPLRGAQARQAIAAALARQSVLRAS